MSSKLPADCLKEIFEYLENDTITLHSCLLVNHLCCEIAVEILWKNICYTCYYNTHISLSIINTLIICLPNESKDLLHKNGICFITLTQKPPLFNYPSFCKNLSIYRIEGIIDTYALNSQQLISSGNLIHSKRLLSQEILKMFMNQISSLKFLDHSGRYSDIIEFIHSPGAKFCLPNLRELKCRSNISPEFFYQISQFCHNIQLLTIIFVNPVISDGLEDLISLQNNLKTLILYDCDKDTISKITPSLAKSSLTITKLEIDTYNTPLLFISMFINLQELIISLDPENPRPENVFEGFDQLQYIKFPKLRVLELSCLICLAPKLEMIIKFLEINGKNLTNFDGVYHCKIMNLAIAKFCPNLKSFYINFKEDKEDELEAIKIVLSSCQFLESIRVQFDYKFRSSKNLFDVLINYSPKNFHKLIICLFSSRKLEGLEEFFINRKNCISQKSLSLIIFTELHGDILDLDLKMIVEKYFKMGVIKEYKFNLS